MNKTAFIFITILTLIGCGDSFDEAYKAFRSPLNTSPSVTINTITGWQTSPATVTGSASDLDNDTLTYRWSEVTSYGVTFSSPENPVTNVAFTGNNNGDVAVNATIRLTVSDGEDESHRDMNLQIFRNNVLFVTVAGTGSGNHPESPLKGGNAGELAAAMTYADSSSKKIVALASGTYIISSALTLIEGVSIYGGYSASDWSRNVAAHESIIFDSKVYGASTSPNGAIKALAGVTNATSLNGIVVEIGRGEWATGIYCYASTGLTIKNCTIRSRTDGSDTNTYQQFGIALTNCGDVVIEGCTISLGDVEEVPATTTVWSAGIILTVAGNVLINGNRIYPGRSKAVSDTTNSFGVNTWSITGIATLRITNNLISSGISENGPAKGVNLMSSTSTYTYTIQNNTICALNPLNKQQTSCIFVATSSGVETIENNIFIATGASYSYCVFMNSTHIPDSLKNNLFYVDSADATNAFVSSGGVPYYNLTTPISTLGTLISLGNITENIPNYLVDFDGADNDIITLSDNDWHVIKNINTPMNLLYGGLDLSADITYDYDGIARTNSNALKATNTGAGGLTIGAYEKD